MEATANATYKKIATFSWLVRRAEAMSRNDPEEFNKLRSSWSLKMIPGCAVHMTGHGQMQFSLKPVVRGIAKGKNYCEITGRQIGGEWYTIYTPLFSTTQWRKSMEDFMPFTMVNKPTWECGAACLLHNADGSVADHLGRWETRRRGKPGSFSSELLVIRDRDGQFINFNKLKWAVSKPGSPAAGKYSEPEFASEVRHYMDFADRKMPNNDMLLGFLPGTSRTKQEFYDSMKPPADRPNLWDEASVKILAARAHAEAIRLMENAPHIKIALYPMRKTSLDERRGGLTSHRWTTGTRNLVALDWVNDHSELWVMPEIVVYWTEAHPYGGVYPDLVPCIRVMVPPIGNPLLEHDGTSPISSVSHHSGDMINPRAKAFHCVRCLKPEYARTHSLRNIHGHGPTPYKEERDKVFVDFSKERGLVMVNDRSTKDLLDFRHDSEFVGLNPEDAFSSIAERALLASLPLC